jgi:hypothetical protein
MYFSLGLGQPRYGFTSGFKFITLGEGKLADNTKFYYGTRTVDVFGAGGKPGSGTIYVASNLKGPWKPVTANITTIYLKQLADKTFIAQQSTMAGSVQKGGVWTAPNITSLTNPTLTFTKASDTVIGRIIQLSDGTLAGIGSGTVYTAPSNGSVWTVTNKTGVNQVAQLTDGTFAYVGGDGKLYQSTTLSSAKTVINITVPSTGDISTRNPDGTIQLMYQDVDGSIFIINSRPQCFRAPALSGPYDYVWSNMWGTYLGGIARVSPTRPMFYLDQQEWI